MPSPRSGSRRVAGPTPARRPGYGSGPPGAGLGSAPPGTGDPPGPDPGRHRRGQPPGRPILLTVLAVLALLLGSGTAIALTAAPAQTRLGWPEAAGLGAPPATGAPSRPGTPAPGSTPSRAPPPEPAPAPAPAPEPRPTGPGDLVDEVTAMEDAVTGLTNAERAAAGRTGEDCGELPTDGRLRIAARGHSQDMAANGYFDHTGRDGRSPFDRMRDAGYPDPSGENIAYGYRTPAEVVAGWMGSDGHRENLLSCSHRAVGVGLAFDPDGRAYWTQNFGR